MNIKSLKPSPSNSFNFINCRDIRTPSKKNPNLGCIQAATFLRLPGWFIHLDSSRLSIRPRTALQWRVPDEVVTGAWVGGAWDLLWQKSPCLLWRENLECSTTWEEWVVKICEDGHFYRMKDHRHMRQLRWATAFLGLPKLEHQTLMHVLRQWDKSGRHQGIQNSRLDWTWRVNTYLLLSAFNLSALPTTYILCSPSLPPLVSLCWQLPSVHRAAPNSCGSTNYWQEFEIFDSLFHFLSLHAKKPVTVNTRKKTPSTWQYPSWLFAANNFRCLKQDQIGSMPLTNGFLISKDKMLFWTSTPVETFPKLEAFLPKKSHPPEASNP